MTTIDLFMWGYQRHFQIAVKHRAQELFNSISPEFEVCVFLLGMRNEKATGHLICLEPEICGYGVEDFSNLKNKIEKSYEADEERYVMTPHQHHTDAIQRRVRGKVARKVVLEILKSKQNREFEDYYFSGFLPVLDYQVAVVLGIKYSSSLDAYRLKQVHVDRRVTVSRSFIDSVADEFLMECFRALNVPEPELVDDTRGRNPSELLRVAGSRLMDTVAWATNVDALHSLFTHINVISSLTYESEHCQGVIVIAVKGHPNIELTLTLAEPVLLKQHRMVRKLLQMTGDNQKIICDGYNIIGFGKLKGNYEEASCRIFEIRFVGHYLWELVHTEKPLMRVKFGTPELPLTPINSKVLANHFSRIIKQANKENIEKLVAISLEASKQRKGALLIISSDAENEAKRLAKHSTPVVPIELTVDLVRQLTEIDGALLLDHRGICYAIGVILDGIAPNYGDSGRGSRYNSSVRYLANRKNSMAIIVSEDGTSEWLPVLKPQISKKELAKQTSEMKFLLSSDKYHEDRMIRILEWLRKQRFYLSQEMCAMGNQIKQMDNQQRQKEGSIIFHEEPYAPDPMMNDEYIID